MSWELTTLGESFELYQPQTITSKELKSDGKYLVYGANGVIGRYDKFNHEQSQLLITCRGATCGAVNISEANSWINGNAMVVKPKSSDIDSKFVAYFFRGVADLKKSITGAAQPQITRQSLAPVKFKYPPLAIQQKIVTKLDAIFAEIDKATAVAEANIKNAEALFQSYLKVEFETTNAQLVKLSSITDEITDGDHQPPPKSAEGIPFITISNVNKTTREIDFSNTFKVSPDYFKALKINKKPMIGDVLYTVTGSFGIPILVKEQIDFCFQRHIGLIRPSKLIDSKWLFWLMLSPQIYKQANEKATGAAQLTVSLKAIRNFDVPNISMGDQLKIVKRLDASFVEIRKLQNGYLNKIKHLTTLKQSILQQAFNGELIKE